MELIEIKIFKDKNLFNHESYNFIKNCINEKKETTIALSGGTTPKPIYQLLAKSKNINLLNTKFYLVDERYVPESDPESNSKMIKESLIKPAKIPENQFYNFDTSLSIKESINNYKKLLPKKSFDLVVLGIGIDGHIASIFPFSKAIDSKSSATHTTNKQLSTKDRLTMTFPTIMNSKKILVLLKGKQKRAILGKMTTEQNKIKEIPAIKLLNHKNLTIFFCEED